MGEFLKSTLHLYMPSSDSWISSMTSVAGDVVALKKARFPKTAGDDQNLAWLNCLPLTSKLKHRTNDKDELFVH